MTASATATLVLDSKMESMETETVRICKCSLAFFNQSSFVMTAEAEPVICRGIGCVIPRSEAIEQEHRLV